MTTALITGANQGLGFALAAELAARLRPDDRVLVTGRNRERVEMAAKSIGKEARVLDVTDATAVSALAEELGQVDLVFSNASAMLTPDRTQEEQADEFIAVANGGAQAILREFGPILRPGGRLIVVASSLGTLGGLDPRLRPLFDDGVTLDDVERAVEGWRRAIHDGTAAQQGWPRWINVPSKVAQVAAVRAVAAGRRRADLATETLVAAVCPGLVDTPLSRPWFADFSRAQSPAKAAGRLLDAVLPFDPALYGELSRFGRVLDWHGDSFGDLDRHATVR
ncbi:SDR family NAD(P)-dependent oxidoreductase [Dactylosporangium sp. NPDC005572]|uniref:SDR family NAD(P)-dependent oxidoreductase n=1 Tax=Dactylosporangium sp. NPDC005572 TaxID=3156889 RepID=UPI00339FA9DB